ncbi:aminotransferase class V-fold PLP-dependent enzyme [uncultured Methylobacterium sp.]|jgi:selenocysteine lyase/cysteine desulfurase|uniref:aminotransferase class V-fold PLP-dependent enzyme n=1 Tax=uncultured Methylobacterium sp. TaxID=157278 RepID=UPI002619F242|nr:aminotransferase class V-fold PLP-dependent enzyme [uncultured Methylobacterium sp.]
MIPTDPLPCQRALFELPHDVSYLDAAAWSPLPRRVRAAGEAGLLAKARPWEHDREAGSAWAERARAAAAGLIGAGPDDVAVVGSVSHGIATAARNLVPVPGGRILRVADEFPSLCLAFDRVAAAHGMTVEAVARPADGDWTAALLAAIARPGAAPLAVATLTPLHWCDGTLIDLERLAPAVRAAGAALVVDATQAVGAMPVDVARLRPDFLAFPTYKWVLGPYGLAFLYAAPHRQDGAPVEENAGNQRPAAGARRYDRGERDEAAGLAMAATGMEMIAGWGPAAVAARLRPFTEALAAGLADLGFAVPPPDRRAGHILGARRPGGLPDGLIARLRAGRVFASDRLGALRLSPHVWTDEAEIARALAALRAAL